MPRYFKGVKRRNKYHARKCVVDGIEFDSQKEARRYGELKLLEKAGVIQQLVLQPKYTLQPKFKLNGKTHRAITYKADFEYTQNGERIVEDVKGYKTQSYKIKKKLFMYQNQDKKFIET